MIVEDSPTVIGVIEALLRAHSYKVYMARVGLAALAALRTYGPDLVLLDSVEVQVNRGSFSLSDVET